MSATGLDVFDKTLQTTNIWLDAIMAVPPRGVACSWRRLACSPRGPGRHDRHSKKLNGLPSWSVHSHQLGKAKP